MSRFKDLNLEYPKGCIIAKAKITDCIYVDNDFRKKVIPKNPNVYKSLNKTEWKGYHEAAGQTDQSGQQNPSGNHRRGLSARVPFPHRT